MRLWQPSPDQPELFDWWRPLLVVGRLAREDRVPWAIHVEEFAFKGRIERDSRPAIWVYEHKVSGRELLADWKGGTYEFIRYRRGRQLGRFKEISVRIAVWRAGLPDVVEPVAYDHSDVDGDGDEPMPRAAGVAGDSDHPALAGSPRAVRRRHLSLVPPPPDNLN
jgi:hypothetical protein